MAIKKKVASKEALRDMSLKQGAKVTDGEGKQFNAAKAKASRRMPAKAKAEPKPEPPAPPPGPDANTVLIAEMMATGNENMIKVMEGLKQQIAEIRLSYPEPPERWVIDWVRDNNGFTTQTILTPVYKQKTIN